MGAAATGAGRGGGHEGGSRSNCMDQEGRRDLRQV